VTVIFVGLLALMVGEVLLIVRREASVVCVWTAFGAIFMSLLMLVVISIRTGRAPRKGLPANRLMRTIVPAWLIAGLIVRLVVQPIRGSWKDDAVGLPWIWGAVAISLLLTWVYEVPGMLEEAALSRDPDYDAWINEHRRSRDRRP
jgi:heme exporter protein D